MELFNKIKNLVGAASKREVVGKDRVGNEFYTVPHQRPDQPAKRLVSYIGDPEPSALHPLWKHWLSHTRDTAPTPKDIYIWEMEQLRLQKRLKEIDEASNKMRAEDLAQRERGDADMGNALSRLTSHLLKDDKSASSATKSSQASRDSDFVVPPFAAGPPPGSNLAFEDGVQVVPKDTIPYAPDPSKLQQMMSQEKFEKQRNAETRSSSSPQFSTWDPNSRGSRNNTDDL